MKRFKEFFGVKEAQEPPPKTLRPLEEIIIEAINTWDFEADWKDGVDYSCDFIYHTTEEFWIIRVYAYIKKCYIFDYGRIIYDSQEDFSSYVKERIKNTRSDNLTKFIERFS